MGYVGSRGRHLLSTMESNPGNRAKCLATPGCGPVLEDTIYDLGNRNFVFGTRPYSVTSGRELDRTTGHRLPRFRRTTHGKRRSRTPSTTLFRFNSKRTLETFASWAPIPGRNPSTTRPGSSMRSIPYNPDLSRALSTFDVTHNFVVSYSYDLPFAKSAHGVKGKLLGGWTISGITRFTTGFPITLSESDDASLCGCSGADVPNYDGTPIHYLDPRQSRETFSLILLPSQPNDSGYIGNVKRRFFHGPGFNNWDLAFHKNTRMARGSHWSFAPNSSTRSIMLSSKIPMAMLPETSARSPAPVILASGSWR